MSDCPGAEAGWIEFDWARARARTCRLAAASVSIGGALSIGGAPLRLVGISARTGAVWTVEGASVAGVLPVWLARPIAKKQANTASMDTMTIGQRPWMRGIPLRSRILRSPMPTLFMTPGTGSVWGSSARRTHQRGPAACGDES